MIIKVTIDVTKIDKARLKENEYKGHTAKNLELILIPTPNGSSHYIVSQGKEQDETEVKMPIIGNAMEFGQGAKPRQGRSQNQSRAAEDFAKDSEEEDVPF